MEALLSSPGIVALVVELSHPPADLLLLYEQQKVFNWWCVLQLVCSLVPQCPELGVHDCFCHGGKNLSTVFCLKPDKSIEDSGHLTDEVFHPSSGVEVGCQGLHGLTVFSVHPPGLVVFGL